MTEVVDSKDAVRHDHRDLVVLFDRCFAKEYRTRLVKGGEEPLYVPACEANEWNTIYFARGYFSSALHEIAHWLVAGEQRRLLEDYGYWYIPDGRSVLEQERFQKAEVKPQAMEWILADACGYRFRISLDNLSGEIPSSSSFLQAVYEQVCTYIQSGLNERAGVFRRELARFYAQPAALALSRFNLCGVY